jgi:hypothetical protein
MVFVAPVHFKGVNGGLQSMVKWHFQGSDELMETIEAFRGLGGDARLQAERKVDEIFSSLAELTGEGGRFHVIMHIEDVERFRALGGKEGEFVKVIDLGNARLTAFCRLFAGD